MISNTKLSDILINYAFLSQNNENNFEKYIYENDIEEIFLKGCEILFNFNFITPQNIDKDKFLKYFYEIFYSKFFDYSIAFETEKAFKLKIKSITMQFSPYYSKAIEILEYSKIEKLFTKHKINRDLHENTKQDSSTDSNSNGKSTGKSIYSEFPDKLLIYDDVFSTQQRMANGTGDETKTENNSFSSAENNENKDIDENITEESGNPLLFLDDVEKFEKILNQFLNQYNDCFSLIF